MVERERPGPTPHVPPTALLFAACTATYDPPSSVPHLLAARWLDQPSAVRHHAHVCLPTGHRRLYLTRIILDILCIVLPCVASMLPPSFSSAAERKNASMSARNPDSALVQGRKRRAP